MKLIISVGFNELSIIRLAIQPFVEYLSLFFPPLCLLSATGGAYIHTLTHTHTQTHTHKVNSTQPAPVMAQFHQEKFGKIN